MTNTLRLTVAGAVLPLALLLPASGASAASTSAAPATSVATSATSAAAAGTCAVTPASTTLYQRGRNVDFDIPSAQYWTLSIIDISLSLSDVPGQGNTLAQFDPKRFVNADAGGYAVKVQRQNGTTIDTCSGSFSLKRGSSLSLSVNKSKASRKVSGTLKRVNFGTAGKAWQNLAGQRVAITYRNGHGVWTTAKTVKTNKKGRFSATVKISKHKFRAVYAGTGTTGARISRVVTR